MKTALVIRHVPFEDLGQFEAVLEARGYTAVVADMGKDSIAAIPPGQHDLAIVLGGPIGAYQEQDYPFLRGELAWLEKRLAADGPTLGICLGAQLMARALGARVYPGTVKEIEWAPILLTGDGKQSALRHLERTPVLHWHGDTFDLPTGAIRLASTAHYENQAFARGRHALALQFHPEVTAAGLERWYIGHAAEITATPDISAAGLREQGLCWAPVLEAPARTFFDEWLMSLERA